MIIFFLLVNSEPLNDYLMLLMNLQEDLDLPHPLDVELFLSFCLNSQKTSLSILLTMEQDLSEQ
jgi:hypothetical protein